jgi:WD40 repeat protein
MSSATMTKTERTCSRCGLVFVSARLDGLCPSCLLTNTLDVEDRGNDERAFWEDEPAVAPAGRGFSHFEIIEELGRGGMGTVYRARDLVTERTIALKVLQSHHLNEPDLVQRFRSEVRAVTSLDHRHILPIHEVGEHNGVPFFSMKLATGGSLAQHLGDYLGHPHKAAQLVAKIARGVQHAHERGILHRDLKPGNILLDDAGEPYVCDFGLAKWIDDDRRLTITSAVLGTPHYIAPEQASGKGILTISADIYSLGAILYELLTGRPPFVGETVIDTLRQASECTPAKPSSIVSRTPRDLEVICLKSLEREPAARYRTAISLAEDLENWLAGRPIKARPVSAAEQLWRWARRNPLPATLGVILLIAITTLAVGSTVAAVKIDRSRNRAVAAEKDAREQLYGALLAQARASRMTDQAGHRIDSLAAIQKAAAIRPSLELRNEAIAALTLVDLEVAKKFKVRESNECLAFDNKLSSVAVASKAGDINIFSLTDGGIQRTLTGVGKPILALVHSGSRYLAARCNDNAIYVWNLKTGEFIMEFRGHPIPHLLAEFASDCLFSPDETLLAMGAPSGIEVVDVATGTEIAKLVAPQPEQFAFTSDGKQLAFGNAREKAVELWRYAEKLPVITIPLPSEPRSLAWSYDQKNLAIGCTDFSIQIVGVAEGKTTGFLRGHRQEVADVKFNHRGDILASMARDRTVRLWDLRTMTELVELPKYGPSPSINFSLDDRFLCTADTTSATVFEVAGLNRICTPFAPTFGKDQCGSSASVEFSPDSTLLATASINAVQCFDVKKGVLLATVPLNPPTQTTLHFYDDGKTLAVLSRKTGLSLYRFSFRDGKFELTTSETKGQFRGYNFGSLPYNSALPLGLTDPNEGNAMVWDYTTESIIQTLGNQPPATLLDMVVSADKKWIVTSYRDQNAKIWSFSSTKQNTTLAGGYGAGCLGFSPSGRWFACSGSGADHLLWNTGIWTKGPALPPQVEAETGRFAFSYDEKTLAVSMLDQVGLVTLPSGEFLGMLEQRILPNPLSRVRFSPDNSQLATQGADNSLTIWNLVELRRELRALNLNWE